MKFKVDNIITGAAEIYFNEQYLGATTGGVQALWEPTYVDVEDDKSGDAVKVILKRENFRVKTLLLEATLDKIHNFMERGPLDISDSSTTFPHRWQDYSARLWGELANGSITWAQLQTGLRHVTSNGNDVYRGFATLAFVGASPQRGLRTYSFPLSTVYSASQMELNRTGPVSIPVEFKILTDIAQTGKEYGTIVDLP